MGRKLFFLVGTEGKTLGTGGKTGQQTPEDAGTGAGMGTYGS